MLVSTRWAAVDHLQELISSQQCHQKWRILAEIPLLSSPMIINTLRVRIRAWLDAQNPASVLMWAPPAAIAGGASTPHSKQRGPFVIFIVLVLFCSCRQHLQREYESRRDLRISDRLPQGVWQHYARASSEWENEFNLNFLTALIQRIDTGCWSCTTRMRSCRKQLRLLAQRGQESNFPAYTVNQ